MIIIYIIYKIINLHKYIKLAENSRENLVRFVQRHLVNPRRLGVNNSGMF